MTRIYELRADLKRYCTFAVVGGAPDGFFASFDGRPLASTWHPVSIELADESPDSVASPDFALLGIVPLLSERAIANLRPLLSGNGELLPVHYPRRGYMVFNVTQITDALNEDKSIIRRFSSGRVISIDKYSFNQSQIQNQTIFKIPQAARGGLIFVSDEFASMVISQGLTGFQLEEVWRG